MTRLPKRHTALTRGHTAFTRATAFLVFWIILLPSAKPADLVIGLIAVFAATWTSLVLLPPEAGRMRFGALIMLLPHFLWQSVLAGFDVARRAFDPRMPLRPGFVRCQLGLPRGLARNTFATITSLLPGSVPAGEEEGAIIYHALDTGVAVAEQIAAEERLLAKGLVVGQRHG